MNPNQSPRPKSNRSDKSFADPERLQQSKNPQVRAALQLLEQDSELADWWENTRASDQLLQKKLEAFSPPSDLQASLNASLNSHARQRSAARKVVQWLSIAATIVLTAKTTPDRMQQKLADYSP